MAPTYIPDIPYQTLVSDLLAAQLQADPRSAIIEALGEHLNTWPVLVLSDDQAEITGLYGVSGDKVRVKLGGKRKIAALGDRDPETVARSLLRELANAAYQKP